MARGQRDDLLAAGAEERIGADHQPAGLHLREIAKAASMSCSVPAFTTRAACLRQRRLLHVADHALGRIVRVHQQHFGLSRGTGSSDNSSNSFGINSTANQLTPVTLPVGRARLLTRPSAIGSPPLTKTIGIVAVAFLAARTGAEPPWVTITLTLRAVNSAANAGSRS